MDRPKILISNDDGIGAEGMVALAEQMRSIGEVCICAPDRNRSGASSSLTLESFRIEMVGENEFSVSGTPADAVHMALLADGILPWNRPDITVAGINCGSNLGEDTIYSGTVAAALESALLGIPGVAFSLVPGAGKFPPVRFRDAALAARDLVARLLAEADLPENLLLNVNIPDLPRDRMGGFVPARLGKRGTSRQPQRRGGKPGSRGGTYCYTMPDGSLADEEGTDFGALGRNQIAVTPLICDLTDSRLLDSFVSEWLR